MAKAKPIKYIFVLGGVISGLGKGIAAASIGYLLKSAGLKVTILKLDPYLNVDPGTMNPRIKAINKPKKFDVVICEVGGTVGDIESLPFMEAIRQLSLEVGYHNHTMMHVTLVPYIQASEELKTKPTQHSVMKLREIGLSPDMILCRTDHKLTKDVRNKIGLFGNLNPDHVIEGSEVKSIYEVPLTLYNQNVSEIIMDRLQLPGKADVSYLKNFIKKYKDPKYNVNIAMCGKYTELPDAYKSVLESFIHAGVENNARVNIHWVATEEIKNDSDAEKVFNKMDGILLLPGFGSRGSEGKIISCKYAREHNVPFLGIHRWEVNNRFRNRLSKKGLIISGENSDLNLVEIVELKDHPWYVAGQFHPELKSRVSKAHPLFREFIKASVKHLNKVKN